MDGELSDIPWTHAASLGEVLGLLRNGEPGIEASGAGISPEGLKEISEELYENTTCRKLNLAANDCGNLGGQYIGYMLAKNKHLEYLHLWGNKIGTLGASFISDGLEVNTTLKCLVVGNNDFGVVGGDSIAKALCVNKALTFLDISENELEDGGALAFSDTLRLHNDTLIQLDLSDNGITEFGMRCLARALKVNNTITELTLAFNTITEKENLNEYKKIGWLMFSK